MKVLVISHTPITTYESMGKTIKTLLSDFSKEDLCQLYIYPNIPNVDICSSFYRITDKDVLRSFYRFKVKGSEVAPDVGQSDMFEKAEDEQLYRNPKNKSGSKMILRDAMWKCSHWYNKALKEWLEREKPDCIFAAPGNAKFLYDIALKISKKRNIPIVSYLCDEYYFVSTPKKAAKKLQVRMLKKKIEKYSRRVALYVTICDELNELYSKHFGVPATTVMTGSSFPIAEKPAFCASPHTITYLGNVRCGRYRSLIEMGDALKEISRLKGEEYRLDVYSGEKNEQIVGSLKECEAINWRGFVSGSDFDKTLHGAEFLLHTESFDERCIELVKNSVSTKIADSLGSGVPLIAYGPSEVASVGHLIRNGCAEVITKKEDLVSSLLGIFGNEDKRKEITANALDTARKYHDAADTGRKMKDAICRVTEKHGVQRDVR